MVAITLKETLGHWVRLFGYFLGVAVVGGAVAGGGLTLLEDVPNWAPGGAAPDVGVKLLAGAGLLAVGALVLLAGFFSIVLVVVATGIRYGVEAAGDDADGDRPDDESAETPVPDPAERLASRRRARRAPLPAHAEPNRPHERAESKPSAGPATEHPDKDERGDATDRGEDWMREVERDLDEEAAAAGQTAISGESITPSHGTDSTGRPPEDEPAPTGERTENAQADDWERPTSETTDATSKDRDETGTDWVGADEIGSDDPTEDEDTVPARNELSDRDEASIEETDVAPGSDELPADVADESDVPADDRPSTASDDPVDDAIDATDGSDRGDDVTEQAGEERETTAPADDPLAPDDFEPEPVENVPEDATDAEDATEATDAEDATEATDAEDATEATDAEDATEATDVGPDSDDDSTDNDDELR